MLPKLDLEVGKDLGEEIEESLEYSWGFPGGNEDEFIDNWNIDGWVGQFHLDKVLSDAIEVGASDVHITADQVVAFTILGDIYKMDEYAVPDEATTQTLTTNILTNEEQREFRNDWNKDTSYEIRIGPYEGARWRVSLGSSFNKDFFVFRRIPSEIPSSESLAIEDEILNWMKLPRGVIFFVGATGTGKTTSIASMLREIQLTKPKKIITIENPIEFRYGDDGLSTVVQREVGMDCRDFGSGLTAALRQNPDIILMGEVRDQEEVNEVLRSAETGHLTITTVHANNVPATINRIQSLFGGADRLRVLATLSDTVKGIAAQVLVKVPDLKGRIAVREILTVNREVADLIASGDIEGIRKYMIDRKLTLEDKLVKYILEEKIPYREAIKHTTELERLNEILKSNGFPLEDIIEMNSNGI